jgi:hypothetical protein
MQTLKRPVQKTAPENAIAKKALEAIKSIEKEAEEKKQAQLASLQEAKAAIHERINELTHQLQQVDQAVASITGRPAKGPKGEGRTRRDWSDVRERVIRWMGGRAGQRFAAGDLIKEFPELDGQIMTMFFRPAIQANKIKIDQTDGVRRQKYFVETA